MKGWMHAMMMVGWVEWVDVGGMGAGRPQKQGEGRAKDNGPRCARKKEEGRQEVEGPIAVRSAISISFEVTVYGQARFFNPPPAARAEPSPGETAGRAGTRRPDRTPKGAQASKAPPATAPGPEQAAGSTKAADGACSATRSDAPGRQACAKTADGATPKAEDNAQPACQGRGRRDKARSRRQDAKPARRRRRTPLPNRR